MVNLADVPILLREIKTRRASNAAAVSGEDAPTTRSGSCKPFPSLLSVGIVITSFNRDEWDAVVLAMENARFFASEARAMMTTRDAAEADAHYEEYKGHMNTLKLLQKRALLGLETFLAEPEPETVLGKRGRDETDDDDDGNDDDAEAAEKGEEKGGEEA